MYYDYVHYDKANNVDKKISDIINIIRLAEKLV